MDPEELERRLEGLRWREPSVGFKERCLGGAAAARRLERRTALAARGLSVAAVITIATALFPWEGPIEEPPPPAVSVTAREESLIRASSPAMDLLKGISLEIGFKMPRRVETGGDT